MAGIVWNPGAPVLDGIAICAPWLAAAVLAVSRGNARIVGFMASLVSVAASALLLLAAPHGESLYEALMVLFSCLTAAMTLVLPKRDCDSRAIGGILFLLGATLLAYSSENLVVFLTGWVLSTIPFLPQSWFRARSWRPATSLLLSSLALAVAIGIVYYSGHALSLDTLKGRSPGGMAAFGLLVVAVIFRKGIWPAHAWVADAAESGPPIPTALLLNGHLGALLVAKLILPLFPRTTGNLFPVLSWLAMATAIYVAIRALTENSPRRLIAFLALSQSACILVGLESRTSEGITGALVHWFVVTISTTGLFAILRLLEVRFGENLTASDYLGLAEHAPRLAVFFAVFGLALVGLPGTLSFCSQELLIHGTLMSHPVTGVVLPIATAMNAVSIFRLFARLFLGRRRTGFTHMADALPRERWTLTVGVLFVVLGGLFPNLIVAQRFAEADRVARASAASTAWAGPRKDNEKASIIVPPRVSIEKMSPEDNDPVFALLQATPGIRLGSADCREAMDRYLLRNPGMTFVARSGNRLAGCVMSGHDGRRGYLYHLAVVPDCRRRGIASRLVAACLAKLRLNGRSQRSCAENAGFTDPAVSRRPTLALRQRRSSESKLGSFFRIA